MKRITIIVLDSVGIGETPDSEDYGDVGSDTLGSIYKNIKHFSLPNMEKLGLRSIKGTSIFLPEIKVGASYGKMREVSKGKDTITGHWEMAGIILKTAFPTYPNGFPIDTIREFEEKIGRKTIGNIVASGTEIIKELGMEHQKTGFPIIYTSADSVFQIAAHEDVINIEKQYEICRMAREILVGEHLVGRVIARPFIGEKGLYERTSRRHDFSVNPISKTILDYLVEENFKVKGVGKIVDIFNNQGVTDFIHSDDNNDGIDKTIKYMNEKFDGLIFANLVDFDMKYGHRNNIEGYGKTLIEFDNRLPEILSILSEDELLIITADHGCDPSTESTDHSREYVPLIVYKKNGKINKDLGIRNTFADIAATISDYFCFHTDLPGESFLKQL
jgi:phosphopentomutase